MRPGHVATDLIRGLLLALVSALLPALAVAQDGAPAVSVMAVLEALRAAGVDVIYSSALVPADLKTEQAALHRAPSAGEPADGKADVSDPLTLARAALAPHGLRLQEIGARRYVVVPAPTRDPRPDGAGSAAAGRGADLDEVSIYASRYAIDAGAAGAARSLGLREVRQIPGSVDDALRALRALPGVATNTSARPYVRGSASDELLIRYDGVALLDPFHFKNFQSLLSAIDPSAIQRLDVYSGGFPVRYGTRAGGVLDIAPQRAVEGLELTAQLSLLTLGATASGHRRDSPFDWRVAARHSTLERVFESLGAGKGRPSFADSTGRFGWRPNSAVDWSFGWLVLDDRIDLGTRGDEEFAQARYRDNYLWLRRAALRDSGWRSTTGLAFTSATRTRQGELRRADLIRGDLSERRSIENLQFSSDWSSATVRSRSFDLGVELAGMRAPYRSTRVVDLAPQLANTFGVISHSALDAQARPRALSLAAYAAVRQHGSALEAEFGLRLDQQRYDPGPTATQLSPRLNLRLELARQWRAYGSLGRFTQAQRVDEWRAEEGQVRPDRGQSAIHAVVGLARDRGDAVRWRIELYDKRWTAKSAYFDSRLDPLALLPDLAPDRVRLAPLRAEARGAELSVRTRLTPTLEAWANASVARVVDDLQDGETVRSWDQPWALTAGLAHTGPRVSVAALLGWHRGWPRTPLQATPPLLGARNSQRWANYFTVDLRADWTRALANGQLSTFAEITNGTNRFNECCADLEMALPGSGAPEFERNQWLPIVVNLGIAFRWHGGARGARSSAPQAASTARDRP